MRNYYLLLFIVLGLYSGAQAPIADFTITSPACSQTNIQFSDLSLNSPTSWSWSFPSGSPSASVLQNPVVQYFLPGTYTITLNVTNMSGTTSITKTITVGQGAGFVINPNLLNICLGGPSKTFTALPSVLGPPLTYSWSTGLISNTLNVNPSVTTVYTCVSTSTSGCTQVNTCTAVVNSNPTVTINATPTSICAGGSSTLNAFSSGPSPNTYSWSTTATINPIVTNVVGNYSVSVTNSLGCIGTGTITLGSSTNLSITATSSSSTICSGNSATLSVSGASSYTWSTGATTSVITVAPTTSTTYTVRGLSGSCTGTTSLILNVNPTPTINISASSPSICMGNSVTLTASGASSYTWNPGSIPGTSVIVSPTTTTTYTVLGSLATCINTKTINILVNSGPSLSVAATPSAYCSNVVTTSTLSATGATTYTWSNAATSPTTAVSPTITTSYSVLASNAIGCTSSKTLSVVVLVAPNVTAIATSTLICLGGSSTLSASGAISYTWTIGTTTATTATIVVTPTTAIGVSVAGLDSQGCSNYAVLTIGVVLCTSIFENIISDFYTVFPNPNSGEFEIKGTKEETIFISNELGQLIETKYLNQQNNYSVKLNNLQSGVYFVGNKFYRQKVVVIK